jgi:DNA-nicking Smr family endonuclease
MRRQRRLPTPAEMALWQSAMVDAKPLAGTPRRAPARPTPRTSSEPVAVRPAPAPPPRAPQRETPALDPQRPIGIDRRNWLRLKRGQIGIERSVDLHGLTQEQAHGHLAHFLAESQRAGLRAVLVVTGKGGPQGGVLRQMVPRWLNEGQNRERILAVAPAQPRHGGAGALYLLLRRARG